MRKKLLAIILVLAMIFIAGITMTACDLFSSVKTSGCEHYGIGECGRIRCSCELGTCDCELPKEESAKSIDFSYSMQHSIYWMPHAMPSWGAIDGIDLISDYILRINTYAALIAFIDNHMPDNQPIPNPHESILQKYDQQFFKTHSLVLPSGSFVCISTIKSVSMDGVIDVRRLVPSCWSTADCRCPDIDPPHPFFIFIAIPKDFVPESWSIVFGFVAMERQITTSNIPPDLNIHRNYRKSAADYDCDFFKEYTLVAVSMTFTSGSLVGFSDLITVVADGDELVFVLETVFGAGWIVTSDIRGVTFFVELHNSVIANFSSFRLERVFSSVDRTIDTTTTPMSILYIENRDTSNHRWLYNAKQFEVEHRWGISPVHDQQRWFSRNAPFLKITSIAQFNETFNNEFSLMPVERLGFPENNRINVTISIEYSKTCMAFYANVIQNLTGDARRDARWNFFYSRNTTIFNQTGFERESDYYSVRVLGTMPVILIVFESLVMLENFRVQIEALSKIGGVSNVRID